MLQPPVYPSCSGIEQLVVKQMFVVNHFRTVTGVLVAQCPKITMF